MAPLGDPLAPSKPSCFIIFGSFRVRGPLSNMLTSVFVKFSFWEMAWGVRYVYFGVPCWPS